MSDVPKPYPAYKDSGVPWLGDVPAHWNMIPNRGLLRHNKRIVGDASSDYTLLSLTLNGIIPRDTENITGKYPASFSSYQIVEPGDLVFCLFDIDETPRTVGLSHHHGMITGAYTNFCCNNTDMAEYIYWYYLALDHRKMLRPLYKGLRKTIQKDTFLSIKTPVPPLPEQRAIAAFLTHHDRLTRRYIRAQQRLIKLLTEQKQALIQQAVTRGLDPDAPLKDSGIPWLGKIPAHWEALRTKFIFKEVNERSQTGEETHLSMSQTLGLVPSSRIEERRLMSESYAGAKLCQKDDLVLNRLKAHLGVFALASEPGIVSPDYTVFRARKPVCPRYFEMLLRTQACRFELKVRAKGIVVGFWRLYTEDFYNIVVSVPPLEEQWAIVEAIDKQLQILDDAIQRAQRQIALVREYRTRLIADVVTGKLDVRDVVLPTDEEAEPFDDIDEGFDDEAIDADDLDSEEDADADDGYQ